MKHPSNRELFTYWNAQRGERLAPERADIEPSAIRKVLGDTFVLEADPLRGLTFRLAGTRLCALFGRELKMEGFLPLWQRPAQAAVRELIAVVMEEKIGIIASATGTTSDETLTPLHLEMILLPLAAAAHTEARVIGALAPMAAPYWLGARAVGPMSLGMFRHIGGLVDTDVPRFRAAAGRLRHGLTVYDGGRP